MRFLLIEDNPELAGSVVERLSLDGHGVDHAASLAEADLCVLRETYDADDYITKPVDFAELGARCRAVLRRHGRGAEQLVLGDLVLDPDQVSVRIGRDSITLRNRELRVLQVLARTPERVYSKAQLHDLVFGVLEAVSDNAIEVYVGRVRKAISASRSVRIETVRGVGYRLVRLDTA